MYRRVFNFNRWEPVSLFIAGLGRLSFIYAYQLLQFKMLKKFTHCSTNVVKHLMDGYLLDSHLNDLCRNYAVCLSMPTIAVTCAV